MYPAWGQKGIKFHENNSLVQWNFGEESGIK